MCMLLILFYFILKLIFYLGKKNQINEEVYGRKQHNKNSKMQKMELKILNYSTEKPLKQMTHLKAKINTRNHVAIKDKNIRKTCSNKNFQKWETSHLEGFSSSIISFLIYVRGRKCGAYHHWCAPKYPIHAHQVSFLKYFK